MEQDDGQRWLLSLASLSSLTPLNPGFSSIWRMPRRAESLQAAHAILSRAQKLHPKDGYIQFNLACYESQLGDIDAARRHLAKATRVNPRFRQMALDDSDLEPLWEHLRFGHGDKEAVDLP